jgi:RNA polymerase sigma-70 factor (ECF subfamily)
LGIERGLPPVKVMESTSSKLLEAVRDLSDAEAWADFVSLYFPLLRGWGRRLGLQPNDADDLAQEVFATLVQKMPHFRYGRSGSFRGWLRTVALNKWRDWQRRLHAPAEANLSDVVDPADAEALWEAEHNKYLVGRALAAVQGEFTPTTWQACWEFVVNERPATEVARQLGISENAVYIAKCRILHRLRECLADVSN